MLIPEAAAAVMTAVTVDDVVSRCCCYLQYLPGTYMKVIVLIIKENDY